MKIMQKKIIGIDIHDYSAELVELNAGSKTISLESFNIMSMPEKMIVNGNIADEEGLKTVLLNLLKTSNPRAVTAKNTVVSFPASKVLTHIFTVAGSLTENEIRKALPFEAESIIPYGFDDIYWDFTLLNKGFSDKKVPVQYVLFACITKEVADKYTRTFEAAGLNPVAFVINAECLKNAVLKQLQKDKTYLALDMGTLSVDYLILKNGTIMDYSSINESGHKLLSAVAEGTHKSPEEIFAEKESKDFYPAPMLEQARKFIERCYLRGQKTMEDYEETVSGGKVEGVVLTGEFLNLPQFYPMAEKIFSGKEIIIGDPKSNLTVDDSRFHLWKGTNDGLKTKPTYAIMYTGAVGAALTALRKGGINLLPDRLKDNLQKKRHMIMVTAASVAMTIIAVTAAALMVFTANNLVFEKKVLEIRKAAVQQVIFGTRYSQLNDHIVAFNGEVNVLSEIDKGLFSLQQVVDDLSVSIPEGIAVGSWSFSDLDLSFSINGIADNRESLLKMRKNFEGNKYISEVIAPISNYDKNTDISYEIILKLDLTKLPPNSSNAK